MNANNTITLFETVTGRTVGELPAHMIEIGGECVWALTREGATAVFEAGWFPVWGFPGEKFGDWVVGVRKATPATR